MPSRHSSTTLTRPGRHDSTTVDADVGTDPVTGSGQLPLRVGSGLPLHAGGAGTPIPEAAIRVFYIAQGWNGKRQLHNTWEDPGRPESPPNTPLGQWVRGVATTMSHGEMIEMVVPASDRLAPFNGSTVLVVRLVEP